MTQTEIDRSPGADTRTWTLHERFGYVELRPYISGEDLTGISVSKTDDPESDRGYIARNPHNLNDQWYVARAFAEKHYRPVFSSSTTPNQE